MLGDYSSKFQSREKQYTRYKAKKSKTKPAKWRNEPVHVPMLSERILSRSYKQPTK
jgi:hypothetical protein